MTTMVQITIDSIIQRNDNRVVTTELDDEMVMMDVQSGTYIRLNKIARVIWEQIQTPLMVNELVGNLINKYEVDENQCEREVIACLSKMEEQGLLVFN